MDKSRVTSPADQPPRPTVCPFCGSEKISTPTKKVDVSTYWRCELCGQMWNVSRHQSSRAPSSRRWSSDY